MKKEKIVILAPIFQYVVEETLNSYRTKDIMEEGKELVGCSGMGDQILKVIEEMDKTELL